MSKWEWTDDPNDPCVYDVQWRWRKRNGHKVYDHEILAMPDDSWTEEPYMPDDSVPPRVCRRVHDECGFAVAAYSMSRD